MTQKRILFTVDAHHMVYLTSTSFSLLSSTIKKKDTWCENIEKSLNEARKLFKKINLNKKSLKTFICQHSNHNDVINIMENKLKS